MAPTADDIQPRSSALPIQLERAYDRLSRADVQEIFKRAVVRLAVGGLGAHLALVFLARELESPPAVIAAVGTNYLAALYTPFSFVLFYEVLLLILSIPDSITRSIGKQYEILSLIVIRNVFKDIAEFESAAALAAQLEEFVAVLLDMAGGLAMFLLVALFYHVDRRRPVGEPDLAEQRRIDQFVRHKKRIALLLAGLLFGLAAVNLAWWSADVLRVALEGGAPRIDVRTIFYLDLFTVMIFADAVILILSLRLTSRYEMVFRNAAFVVSTILLRFSLAVPKPYDVELGLVSMIFGVLVLLVYHYALRARAPRVLPASSGEDRDNPAPDGAEPTGRAPALGRPLEVGP